MDLVSAIGGQGSTAGWSKLGATLGGYGDDSERALVQGQSAGVSLTTKLLDAKKKRDEALALEELESTLVSNGVDPQQAAITAGATRAGSTFQGSTAGLGNLQTQGMKTQALGAATGMPGVDGQPGTAPDMDLVNRIMTVVSGKPQAISKVEGNTLINPLASPGMQALTTTPYGQDYLEMTERARGLQTRTQAETARGKASYSKTGVGGKATDPDKARNAAIKQAASDAFYEARTTGDLPAGTTVKDIEYQLKTRGKWTDPDGVVRATADVNGQELMGDPAAEVTYEEPDLVNAIGIGAGKTDAQAAARDQVRREGDNAPPQVLGAGQGVLVDQANSKLEEARAAIARGADPAQVKARLIKLGYPYIASKL